MKITDQDVIKSGEQELIDTITGDLDWGALEKIFEKDHQLKIGEDVTYKNGNIVIHENQVAYHLEFDVNVTLSLLVDRNGSCLSLISSADTDSQPEDEEDSPVAEETNQGMDDLVPDDTPQASPEQTDPLDSPEKTAEETEAPEAAGISSDANGGEETPTADGQEPLAAAALRTTNLIEEINSDTGT